MIPVTRESPLAKYIYGITPLPNDITEPNIASNLKYTFPSGNGSLPSQNNNPTVVRVDHRFSDKDNFFAKANWNTQLIWELGTAAGDGRPDDEQCGQCHLCADAGMGRRAERNSRVLANLFCGDVGEQGLADLENMTARRTNSRTGRPRLGLPNPYGEIGWPNIQGVGTNFTAYIEGDNRTPFHSTS